jgi:asparagine synthase (glutamine-hydrolysing)
MCGIAGSINFKFSTSLINTMLHRGPDAQNQALISNVYLHHWRLAIMDLSPSGIQPMQLGDRYTIIFNGEIYNHKDLRVKHHLTCNTSSDTETILHLYHKLGSEMLHEFDGMFAIAIYDKENNNLFLARDRAGKKPIYLYQDDEKVVFASELNCLKSELALQINEQNIHQYVRTGFMVGCNTPYVNVIDFPAGSFANIDSNSLTCKIMKWWNIHKFYEVKNIDDYTTTYNTVDNHLDNAVRRRIEASDLEVGSFLSGGIDSGLVTAIASKYNDKLQTFTVSFDGAYDEAPLAKLVANQYNTRHTEIKISFDNLQNDVEKIVANYGEPFADSSAIPSYYVSQAAKQHLTVILNGDGGDELFGGYRRYVPFSKYDFFDKSALVTQSARMLKSILPISNDKKSKYNFLYRLVDLSTKNGIETYLSSTIDSFEGFEYLLINKDVAIGSLDENIGSILKNTKLTGLSKLMLADFNTILFGDLLVKMDIATMAHSLEGRSPLLSKELLEYAPTMADKYKVNGSQTKFILRELAKKYLPADLINQPKRGFEIPLKSWVNNELKSIIWDYLSPSNSYSSIFCKHSNIKLLLENKISNLSAEKRAKMIWSLFCLEVWHKKVILNA